ncbi:hypothetical protein Landi51_04512 [Colletotrichum acutatum]
MAAAPPQPTSDKQECTTDHDSSVKPRRPRRVPHVPLCPSSGHSRHRCTPPSRRVVAPQVHGRVPRDGRVKWPSARMARGLARLHVRLCSSAPADDWANVGKQKLLQGKGKATIPFFSCLSKHGEEDDSRLVCFARQFKAALLSPQGNHDHVLYTVDEQS